MVKKVKMVITLRSGKEVDLPTCKLEHKEDSFWMIKIKRNVKRVKEGSWESRGAQKQGESMACKISQPKVTCCENRPLVAKWFAAAKPPRLEILHFAAETPFGRVFRSCETTLWHTSAISQPRTLICSCKMESIASNGARFGVETKKLWPFEDDCTKLNGNVAAIPHFATESSASNDVRFGLETKKLWPFEDKPRQSQSGNFLISQPCPPSRVFRSFETTLWHTSATSQHPYAHFAAANGLQKFPSSAKSTPAAKMLQA
ncbi:hypothetical protein CK203_111937 [Vitis vinifera]|uniref:Uncharacterized protein n=1 Tax=Vitis vinifera TaxID=29760 RepID=A0A438BMT6_VITVI|nr:hypothetical protein CK203_111937 [Vitis vinifera]